MPKSFYVSVISFFLLLIHLHFEMSWFVERLDWGSRYACSSSTEVQGVAEMQRHRLSVPKLSLCVTYCTEIAFALRYQLVTSEVPSAQGEYGTAAILKGRRTVCYSTENKYVTVHIFISPDKGKSPGIRNRGNIKWVDGLMGCLKGAIKARGFDASEKETLQSIGCSSRKSFGVSTKWVWVGNKGWSCLWRIQ